MNRAGLASICFSLVGLASILLVWIAGSHPFGFYSRLWQYTGIAPLPLVSTLSFGLSTLTLPRGDGQYRLVPAAGLAGSLVPYVAFLLVLTARYYHGAG